MHPAVHYIYIYYAYACKKLQQNTIFAQNLKILHTANILSRFAELVTLNSQSARPLTADRLQHKVFAVCVQLTEAGALLIGLFFVFPIFLLVPIARLFHHGLC